MKIRRHTALTLLFATLLAACGGSDTRGDPGSAPDVAATADGEVKAVDRLGMRSYFAIPYNGKYYLSFPQGAAHSYDLQYLYNLQDLGNEERRALQAAMSRYWTNFARTGNPNNGGDVPANWPAFTGPDKVLGLDVASGGGVKALGSFEADHKCAAPWSMVTF